MFSAYKQLSILDNNLTEKQRSMYAVWDFPVDNFHTKQFPKYEEGKYILPDDYTDAVFKMVNGTRKQRDYYAFFSKIFITVMMVNTQYLPLKVMRRMPATWKIPGVRWRG